MGITAAAIIGGSAIAGGYLASQGGGSSVGGFTGTDPTGTAAYKALQNKIILPWKYSDPTYGGQVGTGYGTPGYQVPREYFTPSQTWYEDLPAWARESMVEQPAQEAMRQLTERYAGAGHISDRGGLSGAGGYGIGKAMGELTPQLMQQAYQTYEAPYQQAQWGQEQMPYQTALAMLGHAAQQTPVVSQGTNWADIAAGGIGAAAPWAAMGYMNQPQQAPSYFGTYGTGYGSGYYGGGGQPNYYAPGENLGMYGAGG